MTTYIDDETYNRLVARLLAIEPDPWTGERHPDAVKIALGEIADVWPMCIRDCSSQVSAIEGRVFS